MTLDVLTAGESRDLLAWNLGAGRAVAELGAVGELTALCGRLPLALCDVAARAVACPGLPLASLVAEMRDARRRLDALETGDSATSVRMVFSWSRAKLGQRAARMFRLLGVHPGPDIAGSAAASLAALPRRQAFLALAELCDEHLLTEWAPGRYTCHDLLRSYAQEEARIRGERSRPPGRDAARAGLLSARCLYCIKVPVPRPQRGHLARAVARGDARRHHWPPASGSVV